MAARATDKAGSEGTAASAARAHRRRVASLIGRCSTRLSELALAGLLALAVLIPDVAPPKADRRPGSSVNAPGEAIAVRRVLLQPVSQAISAKVAAAEKPVERAPVAPAAIPPSGAAAQNKRADPTPLPTPLPVPPASAPSEQQPDQWSEAEVAEAKALCAAAQKSALLIGDVGPPIRNGACGTPAPLSLRRIGESGVELQPAATVNCRLAVALDSWIKDTLQPAATAAFASPVTRILVASSYTCRNRYGKANAPISEHAFANALDIAGFVLADGRMISVKEAWGPTARDAQATTAAPGAKEQASAAAKPRPGQVQAAPLPIPVRTATPSGDREKPASDPGRFLRDLHKSTCATFGTVLGPEANEAHRDHLHVDLKERRHAHICE